MKIKYHAVLLDETQCEFGVSFEAVSRDDAYKYLSESYPESQCVQLEDNADTRKREARIYAQVRRAYDDGIDYYEQDY